MNIAHLTDEDFERMRIKEDLDRSIHKLTEDNLGGLIRYIEHRIEPGSFLHSVLENDLKEACARADSINRRKLFEYVEWLYNEAPHECWGSPEKVSKWLSGRDKELFEAELDGI